AAASRKRELVVEIFTSDGRGTDVVDPTGGDDGGSDRIAEVVRVNYMAPAVARPHTDRFLGRSV
ncbi:MAG TPA: hypothetical protein VFC57_03980, partial [Aeromicrobium sp.]|nr:hypothetical protein [Aeromicrobium sp.]